MEAQPKEIRYYVTGEDVSPFLVCGQSKSYREFLLENLQDEAHAAGYLTVALTEENADAAFLKQLMQSAIDDVIEAQSIDGMVLPEVNALRDRFATAQAKDRRFNLVRADRSLKRLGNVVRLHGR
jgi:hypothetical protein